MGSSQILCQVFTAYCHKISGIECLILQILRVFLPIYSPIKKSLESTAPIVPKQDAIFHGHK